jgi:mono/diheme cytochrome c family protein
MAQLITQMLTLSKLTIMKKLLNNANFPAMAILGVFLILASYSQAQVKAKPWPVPQADKVMKAGVKMTDASVIASGKELWMKHCKSCHGSTGLGDGPKGSALKTLPGDFTVAAFQSATDGELYYRLTKGRDEMPAFDKKIPEADDRWALVAFMRTLKK